MLAYIVRRLVAAVGLLFVLSLVTFAIFYLLPRVAGATPESLASRYVGRTATEDTVKLTAERLGFYDPVPVQYGSWIKGVFTGAEYDFGAGVESCPAPCLGYSFITRQPVWPELLDRAPVTGSLALGASLIWLLSGVAVGVVSALRRGSFFDRAAMTVALAGVSLPIFFTGLVSLAFFSYRLNLTAPGGSYVPFLENPAQWGYSLFLPWITLAFLFSAQYARLTRAGMLDTMSEDYIRTARAKGLTSRRLTGRHGMRAAITPLVTALGVDVGLLVGGNAILTETVFGIPGLGRLSFEAIQRTDLATIQATVLFLAFIVCISALVVDVLYAFLDPRVKYT